MEIVQTDNAPIAIGPYSQAVVSNGFVYCSGQIALRPDATLVDGPVEVQFKQVMENLSAVLNAAGSSLAKVVKTTIFLKNMDDFQVVNELYANYFDGSTKPARATVEVSRLPKDVKVEVDCIAEI